MLRVVVIGPDKPVYQERDAAETITPGHIVADNAAGKAIKNTVGANPNVPVRVAVENDIFGGGIDDNWTLNQRVIIQHLRSGCEFMGIVNPGTTPAINAGDPVTTDGAGGIVVGTAANAIGRAMTPVPANPVAPTRVRVLVS